MHEPVLIFGATGFAGGALAKRLRGEGKRVRALVRPGSDATALERLGVEVVRGDIIDAAQVMCAVEGAGTIYNFASPFRSAKPTREYFHDVNVGGVMHVIEAARTHRANRTVHCSTIGVHGDVKEIPCREDSPFNPGDVYQETKLEGELAFRAAMEGGLPGVVMRPTSMYGPGDLRMLRMFDLVYRGKWWTIGDGSAWFHPGYIDDLVDGFILCGEHPDALGETFILIGPEAVQLRDLVNRVADVMGVPRPKRRLPLGPMLVAARLCERLCRPFGIEPPLHERRVRFFTNNRKFDGSKARQVLGYQPKVTLQEGIRRTAEWYFDEGHLKPRSPG